MESKNASELRVIMEQNEMGARSPTYLCGMGDDLFADGQHKVF